MKLLSGFFLPQDQVGGRQTKGYWSIWDSEL
jgi:hypothetical protein